jgi:hypothetical protein
MMHPHLGKHDLSKKRFYQIIAALSILTTIVVAIVVVMTNH